MLNKINNIIKIGTRGSPLALWQAKQVSNKLPHSKIIEIKTTGDTIIDQPLASIGGKGLFTKELDQELINGSIDIAVHSLKDVPTIIPKELSLAYILPRGAPEDILISNSNSKDLISLPQNTILGTSSPRRYSQIKRIRPDIIIKSIRGNVSTRINKIKDNEISATILALAGITRLNIDVNYAILDYKECMPPASQGIVGITYVRTNENIKAMLELNKNLLTQYQALGERSVLKIINGDCHSSVAVTSSINNQDITIYAKVFSKNGSDMVEASSTGKLEDAQIIGENIGHKLIEKGGLRILKL
jgi:hydroxymethylbilane synthase